MDNRQHSMKHNTHRLRRISTIADIITLGNESLTLFWRIIKPEVGTILYVKNNMYAGLRAPDNINFQALLDMQTNIWLRCSSITSRKISLLRQKELIITDPKLLAMNNKEASHIHQCINNLVSAQSKTKMKRLIHFDVYCGTGIKKIGLIGNDTCIRCLERETIKQLMIDCPYTQEILVDH